MRIKYFGHSSFLIETNGIKILTDPYDPSLGYEVNFPEVDVVTISHEHFDHNAVNFVPKYSYVLRGEVDKTISSVKFESIYAFHDKKSGKERGKINIFKIISEDISIVHFGDLGDTRFDETQKKFLKGSNIFLIPVGGFYTIGPDEAHEIIDQFKPNIAIPMHYKLKGLTLNILGVDEFLKGYPYEEKSELEITKENLPNQKIVVLKPHIK